METPIREPAPNMLNRGYRYRHVIDQVVPGDSTVDYLARRFPHSTRDAWRLRIEAGEVSVDGRTARADQPPIAGQLLVWDRPGWLESTAPCRFDVVYQDEQLVAVDKPSGLPTLPGGGFFENTLLSLVRAEFPTARPLHRLGRGTSGLVLFALTSTAAATLSRNWPEVRKQYRALGAGAAREDRYSIDVPIGPVEHPRLGRVHAADSQGKPSRSVAVVIERRSDATLFEVDLLTGRPHQIRIHLAAIGHPLVGDPLYASGGRPHADPGLPGDGGYWLHAGRLTFAHPTTGATVVLTAPPPRALSRSKGEPTGESPGESPPEAGAASKR